MPEFEWQFTLVLLTNGIMIGLMYALIALGFVLIYKATDAINFAQGEFVMFAGFLAAVAAEMAGMPFWLSSLVAIAGMIALGSGLGRVVLRPLIGRPVIAVVMATIGLAAVLRGTAVMAFGAGTRAIIMPVSDEPFELGPIMLPPVQLVGAGVSLVFLAAFTWFFLKSRTGIAMRAVADSQQVAMAMGINVRRYFALAWAMAGVVSALGGVVWGTMLGVDNQLALVGLKVFPVVILGGLDSVMGAVIGGLIACVGALGLNILVGYTGQISIGHGAFMSVGAYTAANLVTQLHAPFWITIPAGGLMAALIGAIVGIPSLRIKGIYLAIATLAAQLIIEWTINHVPAISGGVQASIQVPRPSIFGVQLKTQTQLYLFLMGFAVLAIIGTSNLVRSRIGRAFIAVRDQDIAAEIIGISTFRYKLIAFAISSFYAGITGVLYTYYLGIANYEQFQLTVSIDYLAMVIIGGLGSILGSILGAIFVTLLPIATRWFLESFGGLIFYQSDLANIIPNLRLILFGGLIIFFLVVEPEGLNRLWRNIRNYFRVWPFSY